MFPKILKPYFSGSEQDSTASSFSSLITLKDHSLNYQGCRDLGSPPFYRWESKREQCGTGLFSKGCLARMRTPLPPPENLTVPGLTSGVLS